MLSAPLSDDLSGLSGRGVAQLVRVAVSKTVGRGFESLLPCHFHIKNTHDNISDCRLAFGQRQSAEGPGSNPFSPVIIALA